MAKIDVRPNELTSLRTKLTSAAALIEDAEQLTANVLQNLDFEVAAKEGIRTSLSQLKNGLGRQNSKVNSLAECAALAAGRFQEADSLTAKASGRIANKIVEPMSVQDAGVRDFISSVQISRVAATGGLFLAGGSVLAKSSGGKTSLQRIADSLKKSLETFMKRLRDAIRKSQVKKPAKPVKKVTLTNTSSSYQIATDLGMTYYTQGKTYNKEHWDPSVWKGPNGKDYSKDKEIYGNSCDVCCDSMVVSHFGGTFTPGQWLEAKEGTDTWTKSHKTIEKKFGLTRNTVANKATPVTKRQSLLDQSLNKYLNDPDHNGPPMVGIYNKGADSNHYVLVVGKHENGDYIIIDPANDTRTRLTVTTEATGNKSPVTNKQKLSIGYVSGIKEVITWTKK